MKIKTLIEQLSSLPPENEIIITAMDDYFACTDFEVHSSIGDAAQELILNCYIQDWY